MLDAVALGRLQALGEIEHEPKLVRRPRRQGRQVAADQCARGVSERMRLQAEPRAPDRGACAARARRGSRRGPLGRGEGAGADARGDLLMGVAERDAVAYEQLRGVGRAQQWVGDGVRKPVVVQFEPVDQD